MNRALTRHLLALAVAVMGVIDLWSALLSRPPDRLIALRRLLPTDVLDTSRTFTLVAGALLLVTASGLWRGKRRAFVAALFLSALSVPVNMLKAFDFEEATVAAGLLFLLGISGDAFRVKSRELTFRALRSGAAWFVLAFALYAVIGCWMLEFQFGETTSIARASSEALYRVFGIGSPSLSLPATLTRHQEHVITWFLDSLAPIGLIVALGLAIAALRPATYRTRHRQEVARVAELVRIYGDNSVAAFALDSDADYFFSANRRAVIAYRFESDTLLVIGDPIGPPEEIPPLLQAFSEYCRERDWQFAFFQARPERMADYRRLGWRALHIGEDPILWTDRFTLEGSAVGELRRGVRKLERQGLEARIFVPGENPFDPDHDSEGMLDQMKEISAEWLSHKQGGEKGFCMGRFDPTRLDQHLLAIAWNPPARRVEAFCAFVPVWARQGWAIDLMRRRHDAPTATMEFLVVKTLDRVRQRGDAFVSLALSALAKVPDEAPAGAAAAAVTGMATAPSTPPETPAGDDAARTFLMDALARYYDFKGLFRWKRKFNPAFEDRFLVFSDPMALPRVARALLRVQTPAGFASYFRARRERAAA
ncbi:MAG TPA: phosphatidylglycerol lysyltransferase domain-containing protein [Candidatus Sulfotelmatobacter sp.]|nr:phosphatidylglycerol lysyltransferase domain-containing protein [Candidatus Sulfotelmatobacter sp.]